MDFDVFSSIYAEIILGGESTFPFAWKTNKMGAITGVTNPIDRILTKLAWGRSNLSVRLNRRTRRFFKSRISIFTDYNGRIIWFLNVWWILMRSIHIHHPFFSIPLRKSLGNIFSFSIKLLFQQSVHRNFQLKFRRVQTLILERITMGFLPCQGVSDGFGSAVFDQPSVVHTSMQLQACMTVR